MVVVLFVRRWARQIRRLLLAKRQKCCAVLDLLCTVERCKNGRGMTQRRPVVRRRAEARPGLAVASLAGELRRPGWALHSDWTMGAREDACCVGLRNRPDGRNFDSHNKDESLGRVDRAAFDWQCLSRPIAPGTVGLLLGHRFFSTQG